jgi:inosine-uridine nucleoside N-ribohydrolase
MSRPLRLAVLLFFSLSVSLVAAADPVRFILDTDIGNDVDDALALGMIHALENRSEVQLLAVTITKDNRYAAPFVGLIDSFYGRPDIPIGVVHNGKTPADADMLKIPVERRGVQGKQAPEAVELLTRILTGEPDQSVTIAQIGFSTNLARLVASPAGRDLVQRKVKLLCLMAGNFVKPQPEYNVYTDPDSFRALLKNWPTPIIFSGFEVGLEITFPYESIQKDFNYAGNHPIAEAYRIYVAKAEDHPNWDSTAVLEAIRPDRGYFDLSAPGRVSLGEKSTTVFTPEPQGNCRYLVIKPEQVSRLRELMAALVSEPPQPASTAAGPRRLVF